MSMGRCACKMFFTKPHTKKSGGAGPGEFGGQGMGPQRLFSVLFRKAWRLTIYVVALHLALKKYVAVVARGTDQACRGMISNAISSTKEKGPYTL
jgi:hypothetical protein